MVRIVLFAPLYVSATVLIVVYIAVINAETSFRRKLTDDEIRKSRNYRRLGHKRIALEAGEDDENCPIEYILNAMDVIYRLNLKMGAFAVLM